MRVLALVAAALLAAAVPPVEAQQEFPGCGDIELVFRNPDLQLASDGFVHASGQFFIQFQAIGPAADQIATFGFSFGPDTIPFDEGACDLPIWFTGPYVINYRADRDASDGFFIPLKTDLVPDGTYAAAVHAYDAQNNELARFWARAIVDNCDGDVLARCTDNLDESRPHDTIQPWPIVLPGDGVPLEGHHLSIEFAEPIANLTVALNGQDITGELSEWDGRIWDADYFPDYGPQGIGDAVAPPCTLPVHTCIKYGPAYEWNGRALTNDDVVRVTAVDMNGNVAVKDIHVGSGIAGGAVTSDAPNLQVTVDAERKSVAPGASAVFRFDMQNTGGGTAHPFTTTEAPDGWSAEFLPHQPIEPGARRTQELTVTVPATAAPGAYPVNATINYPSQGREESRTWHLTVDVQGQSVVSPTTSDGPDNTKDSPGAVAPLVVLGLVAVAWRVGRRN